VVPVGIALLSLALSVYTIIEANREATVWLSAPVVVRAAVSSSSFTLAGVELAQLYVQPRLVSTARNDRLAVITNLALEVTAPGGDAPIPFTWREEGNWQYNPVGPTSTYYSLADPAPLVVSPSSPQRPICMFIGPPGWQWQPGSYLVTIIAERGEDAAPLRAAFTMTLPEESVESITASPGAWVKIDTQAVTPVPS
jgi:hypothetical protein